MFLPWFKSIYIKAANEKNTEAHTVISANFVTQREVYYNGMGSRSVCIRDNIYRDSDTFNVWICPGLPLRSAELSILCFSGSNRNLYFDAGERVFLIKSRYNKSHKFDSRILFLDVPFSAVLFWFIYILRPFIMSLYPVEVGHLEKGLIVSSIGKACIFLGAN